MRSIVASNKTSIRFILIGILNTIIDFGIYTLLISAGMSSILANYPATTTAMVFSFFANKKYTFRDNSKAISKQIINFLLVTLTGLWVLQPITIFLLEDMAQNITGDDTLGSLMAKVVATVVSLSWNYVLYSRVVFKPTAKEL
jgi:putative flippase GtrA